MSQGIKSKFRLNDTLNRLKRPPDLEYPQPNTLNQLPPLNLRPLLSTQACHHGNIRRRHTRKGLDAADEALVDQELRIARLHCFGEVLENLARLLVFPVVEHVVHEVGSGAFDGLRGEEVVRVDGDGLRDGEFFENVGEILQN
ncbi:hypothetical protein HG530_001701 [Fusarium avenaceum]|nr:hypothetical protein HG530_001701 [Fusarium avenaceum]